MSKKQKKGGVFQPDDLFFGTVMSEPQNAKAYLQDLYPEVAARANLDTLQLVTDRFFRPKLKIFRSDIIYRCALKEEEGHFYFALIWEHKLQPEEEVAIQIGLYIFLHLYKLSKAKDRILEPILPLLFYNGKKAWIPKTVHEIFEDKPYFDFFKNFLPNFTLLFKNITATPPEELLQLQSGYFRSAMMSMAFRYRADLIIEHISIIFEAKDKDQLNTIIHYVLAVMERSPEKFMEELEDIEFTTKPEIMSTLAMLKAEGKAEGIIVGEAKEKAFLSLKNLLKLLIKFPNIAVTEIAYFTEFKSEVIVSFLETLKTKKVRTIKSFMKKHFLSNIKLNRKELKAVDDLLKTLLK